MTEETIGQRLFQLRQRRRWTQFRLAQEAKTTPQTVQNIESGRSQRPQLETLRGLAEALEVSVQYLEYGYQAPGELPPAWIRDFHDLHEPHREVVVKLVRSLREAEDVIYPPGGEEAIERLTSAYEPLIASDGSNLEGVQRERRERIERGENCNENETDGSDGTP